MGRLRVLSGREVCRILQQHGFAEVRRRGSHVVMQRPTDTGSPAGSATLARAVARLLLRRGEAMA